MRAGEGLTGGQPCRSGAGGGLVGQQRGGRRIRKQRVSGERGTQSLGGQWVTSTPVHKYLW